MNRLINQCLKKAKNLHKGQTRKGDGQPYITHPIAVYNIAKTVTDDTNTLCACLLHDTVEDTPMTIQNLSKLFNSDIAFIVKGVTENKSIKNWHKRKLDYLINVQKQPQSMIVAWADKVHNTQSLKRLTDYTVFNVSIKEKLNFYQKFAELLTDEYMKNKLLEEIEEVRHLTNTR